MFINGDLRVVNGNGGLKKYRSNTITIIAIITKIVEKKLDKYQHLTPSMCQDGTRELLKLAKYNMSHGLLCKMNNEEIELISLPQLYQSSFKKIMRN